MYIYKLKFSHLATASHVFVTIENISLTLFAPEAISSSCTQQCSMDLEVETETVLLTTTFSSTILLTKSELMAGLTTMTVTISASSRNVAETNSVTICTPDNAMIDHSLQSDGSMTALVVLTILFFVIAVSAVTFSIFVGYFSNKTIRTLKNALVAAIAANNTKQLVTEGKFTCNN